MSFRHRDAIARWMFDAALPWWAANGLDRRDGGYVEHMTLDGRDGRAAFKRTRVTARQIYVFSHAHVLGFTDGAALARHGFEFLTQRTWNGPERGFARRLSRTGDALDPTPDLYDHAFCLYAFAWFHRATGDPAARDWMHRTLDFVEQHMRHPSGDGFHDELPPPGRRQQNPHMHLAEAALASFAATGEERFATLARELTSLFARAFFDPATATLAEIFTEDWRRAPGDEGRCVEPGHHLEWAWILDCARRDLGIDLSPQVRAAVGFAERYGIDPVTRATYNVVRDDGVPLDRGSRTWPNTERLKAAVALLELDGTDPTRVFDETCGLLLERYLGHAPAGTWIDAFDGDGRAIAETIPASTLYHLFLAFAEVLRVADAYQLG